MVSCNDGHHGRRAAQHCQWAVYTLCEPYVMQSRKFPASLPGFPYVFSFRFPFLSYSFPVWLLSENIPHTFRELFTFRQDTFQHFEFGMRVNDSFTSQTLAPQIAILSHASRRVLFTFIQNAAAT
jgi:hypothetical protein